MVATEAVPEPLDPQKVVSKLLLISLDSPEYVALMRAVSF
jgi:hypothetical protein